MTELHQRVKFCEITKSPYNGESTSKGEQKDVCSLFSKVVPFKLLAQFGLTVLLRRRKRRRAMERRGKREMKYMSEGERERNGGRMQ